MKKFFTIVGILLSFSSLGQDSLRIMFYNLLNFPSTDLNRYVQYETFLEYSKPDVFVVNELDNEIGANLILDSALNVNGTTSFQSANFIDGYDTDNCLFYNADKLGMVSQLQLNTLLRDISVYRLYYKAPNLNAQSDTIYFWFFSCHLKAGSADFEQRNQEAQVVKYYLNDIADQAENVFVGGDFNFYSGFESGCQTLLNTGSTPLIDPVNAVGNWSGNFSYADWHTQSTRNSGLGGGAGGGMDDRFDLIFVSEDVMNNNNGVSYINNSYTALGQDGNHYNDAINSGTNLAVPDSIADALYFGSDHLPIMMDVVLDETASTAVKDFDYMQVYYNTENRTLNFLSSISDFELVLFDLMGREVFNSAHTNASVQIPTGLNGVYVWSINSGEYQMSDKIVIH